MVLTLGGVVLLGFLACVVALCCFWAGFVMGRL